MSVIVSVHQTILVFVLEAMRMIVKPSKLSLKGQGFQTLHIGKT